MEYKLKVVAGHLIFLPDNLPVPFESDIACSQLFMQLYADAQVDRFSDIDKWDQCFSRARSNMKWITTLSHAVNVKPDEHASYSVVSEISRSLMQAQPNEPGIAVEILHAGLKNFAGDECAQRVFFESALKRPAPELKSDENNVSSFYFLFSVLKPLNQLLSVQLYLTLRGDPGIQIFERALEGVEIVGTPALTVLCSEFNTLGYENVREKVNRYLKSVAVDKVIDLAIN
ncbi:hypothetical protein [Pseudomonas lundensis]|uniref:Uncharacterized protein n=1 Tax=Pseudomonas lundensis TaxID=86185 RepID=A0AAX2HFT8_9PSED|nr:hypothetical protein [Pseudomonas lundensis]SOB55410.1 hypothetical protein PLUA15_90171 [Pseudomonas lundensis]